MPGARLISAATDPATGVGPWFKDTHLQRV